MMIHRQLLFVYGTLKRGFHNHKAYLQLAEDKGVAVYCGAAKTVEAYPLVIGGERTIPFLLDRPGEGRRVHGEVYKITDSGMEAMDILEGVSTGRYRKIKVRVEGHDDCWAYFVGRDHADSLDLESKPRFDTYSATLHADYIPPTAEPNPTILRLLQE